MRVVLVSFSTFALAACASPYGGRSLNTTPISTCVAFCITTNTQADTQEDIKSEGGGAISNTTQESQNVTETFDVGGSTEKEKQPSQPTTTAPTAPPPPGVY